MHLKSLSLLATSLLATGLLTSSALASGPCPCATDLNNDGMTDAPDLALLLGAWGGTGLADFDASGSVDAADLAILLGEWGPCDPPANDNCSNVIVVEGTSVSEEFCNSSATDSPVSFPASCDGDLATIGKDMWYRYVAPYDGKLIVNTYDSSFDTVLGVYGSIIQGGCACPGGQFSLATLLACNDDASASLLTSFVEIDISEGDCITARVGGYKYTNGDTAEGPGVLNFRPIKRGDRCDIAHELPSEISLAVDGTNAGDTWIQADQSSCANGDEVDEWYRYVMPCDGTLDISTCDPATNFDTTLAVYSGCGGLIDEIDCNDDSTTRGCQLNGLNRKSEISINAGGGDVIYIRVSGFQNAVGTFKLIINADCLG